MLTPPVRATGTGLTLLSYRTIVLALVALLE